MCNGELLSSFHTTYARTPTFLLTGLSVLTSRSPATLEWPLSGIQSNWFRLSLPLPWRTSCAVCAVLLTTVLKTIFFQLTALHGKKILSLSPSHGRFVYLYPQGTAGITLPPSAKYPGLISQKLTIFVLRRMIVVTTVSAFNLRPVQSAEKLSLRTTVPSSRQVIQPQRTATFILKTSKSVALFHFQDRFS